ncbi:MAG: NAD(P)/FAD-dependent oxidoreductase [Cyclobacteriaceae bacterium]|nr:NAD(P)/FAD-dependent oxidoreductase [Cyclobacteriaceae bacterium]
MKYDAVIIGSGPNGLAAAIRLQQEGLKTLLLEGKDTVGGGMRTQELTLAGFKHDICSAIHPLAYQSPFLKQLPLADFGLEWVFPTVAAAHPLDKEAAALLYPDIDQTAAGLGRDEEAYRRLMQPLAERFESILPDFLGPLRMPKHKVDFLKFSTKALLPANWFQSMYFKEERSRALFAGLAAHAILPLHQPATAAIGLVLGLLAHPHNWPFPKGGSQSLANALAAYYQSLGGEIILNQMIHDKKELPEAKAYLFDTNPNTLLQIMGDALPSLYRKRLQNFRYGMGVFKVDYAIAGEIPWADPQVAGAGTVHLGGKFNAIAKAEAEIWKGIHPKDPYVLLAQQSNFDRTRAPEGKNTVWAYCHVPQGSTKDMNAVIDQQIERFAPGFCERILARHSMNTEAMEVYNPNYFRGDINGGAQDILQVFTRPIISLNPYRTPTKGVYLCSSSTPPGGGVHGMGGFHAAESVLRDLF